MQVNKVTIIPDVHGRSFWKKAVESITDEDTVIFLGDYVDPYFWEGIPRLQAIENFKEIIEFKKLHSNVILLFGNHDLHYLNKDYNGSRMDYPNWEELHSLYTSNKDLFTLCHILKQNDKYYMFSHAGLLKGWLHDCSYAIPSTVEEVIKMVEFLNDEFKRGYGFFDNLYKVSVNRGGWDPHGSIIWADIHEHFNIKEPVVLHPDVYQIVGHTQLESDPLIKENIADLDVREAFTLENGSINRKET